jgi:phosphoribosylglycinamide formyltransferase-1
MSERRGRVAILCSGRGSNMAALVTAMREGKIKAEPALVLTNNPGAAGLARARQWGIPTEVIDHRQLRPREAHERAVLDALTRYEVDLVCLAGYMRLLGKTFVHAYHHRMMNIHPSLLPAFPGLDAQAQALHYGAKVAGCTVHFVDEVPDGGPIILQAAVPVLEDDTEETLSARILEQEHRIYPEAVALFFDGRLKLDGRRVHVLAEAPAERP